MASQAHIIQHVLSLFNGEPNPFKDNRFKKGFLLKLNVFESKSRLNLSKYRRHQVFGLRFHTMGDLWLGSVGITNLSTHLLLLLAGCVFTLLVSFLGTLTAVESFLTISTGAQVDWPIKHAPACRECWEICYFCSIFFFMLLET